MKAEKIAAVQKSDELPIFPKTSTEYVNTIAHFYRGEMGRMVSWRDRLDRTTNWAVGAAAAMLSIALSSPDAHHGVLLFSIVVVFLLLWIESRRYRFYDVFRTRVRLLERHYYANIFNPRAQIDADQRMSQLSAHLRSPSFSITYYQAMGRRLRRGYCWIFIILLIAWLIKVTAGLMRSFDDGAPPEALLASLLRDAAVGYVPGGFVLGAIAVLYGWMGYIMVKFGSSNGENGDEKVLV